MSQKLPQRTLPQITWYLFISKYWNVKYIVTNFNKLRIFIFYDKTFGWSWYFFFTKILTCDIYKRLYIVTKTRRLSLDLHEYVWWIPPLCSYQNIRTRSSLIIINNIEYFWFHRMKYKQGIYNPKFFSFQLRDFFFFLIFQETLWVPPVETLKSKFTHA